MVSLTILSGSRHGEQAELLGDELLIGRVPDCDLQLPDPAVSSRHARLIRRDSLWTVEDLDSTNGTRLNGFPITRSVLKSGDELICGSVALRFETGMRSPEDARRSESPSLPSLAHSLNDSPTSLDRSFEDVAASFEDDDDATTLLGDSESLREISQQTATRIQQLLHRARRDHDAWDGWLADCALFVRALRLIDWTRLPPRQQRMLRELVEETQPEAVLRNMQSALMEWRDTTRLALETAAAATSSLGSAPLSLRDALTHARALADTSATPLTATGEGETLILPLPPATAIQLLGLLMRLGEHSNRGLTLRAFEDAWHLELRVEGAPKGLEALSGVTLRHTQQLLTEHGGILILHQDHRGTSVEITLPW